MRINKGFSNILLILSLFLVFIIVGLILIPKFSSNTEIFKHDKSAKTVEIAQFNNSKVLNPEFIDCTVYIHLVSGEKLQVGKVNSLGMENPLCLQSIRYSVSPSGKYVVFEDVSGGIDSAIRIYSLDQNKITTLYVYGTTTIMDLAFLSGDVLAVMNGYPDILNEQWLTAYDVPTLYENYENAIIDNPYPHIENQFIVQEKYSKKLYLPNLGENYSYLRITTESVVAHTENSEKFVVFTPKQFGFSD